MIVTVLSNLTAKEAETQQQQGYIHLHICLGWTSFPLGFYEAEARSFQEHLRLLKPTGELLSGDTKDHENQGGVKAGKDDCRVAGPEKWWGGISMSWEEPHCKDGRKEASIKRSLGNVSWIWSLWNQLGNSYSALLFRKQNCVLLSIFQTI